MAAWGGDTSPLSDPAKRAALAAFIESIDERTPIFKLPGEPLVITDIEHTPTEITVNWAGGTGPFALQKKQELNEAYFTTVATTTDRFAKDALSGSSAFYRVFDLDHAPAVWLNVALSGAAERPNPVDSLAFGFGYLRVKGDTLSFTITYQGLSGPAVGAQIHGPASASEAGGVLIDLAPFKGAAFGTSGTFIGSVPITTEQKAHILGNRAYVNILTAANPGGEVRGQGVTVVMKVSLSGSAERPNPVATSAGGFGVFTLVGHDLSFQIHYNGLSGPATAAHIHGPASDAGTEAPIIDLQNFATGGFGPAGAIVGTVALDNRQLSAILDGKSYVNIHTAAHPGGEIRGQITVHNAAVPFSADLSGAAQRPNPVDTPATGFASLGVLGHKLQLHGSMS